jgi:hypothetical protein
MTLKYNYWIISIDNGNAYNTILNAISLWGKGEMTNSIYNELYNK